MTKEDIKYCLLLFISVILSYFQLSFFIFSTKWDNLSAFFPYKYTASKWWLSGILPLWDPYQNLGYPMHANPQGFVWYPITWILNLPSGYSLYSLNLETVLHVVIASIGMYFLAKWLKMKPSTAFLAGLTYGLSGFIIASNHMVGFTIGAAWLPWAIYSLLLVLNKPTIRSVFLLAIVCYLQITGAYIAFTILLFYIFLFLIVQHIILNWKLKAHLKQVTGRLAISLILILILSSPYLFSIYDSLEYFSRAKALDYDIENYARNFNWQCFQSLFAPYINSSKAGFEGVDVSLSNIYIGIIPLLFLFLSISSKKLKLNKLYLLGIAVALLLALGIHTPVHYWFAQILPGFNLFRHPYLFTLYFTLLSILVAFKLVDSINEQSIPFIRKVLGYGLILLGCIWLFSFIKAEKSDFISFFKELAQLPEKTSYTRFFHAFIQLSVSLILLTMLIVKAKNLNTFTKVLPLLIFIDLFIAIQLNGPTNMYYNIPFGKINQNLGKLSNAGLTNQEFDTPLASLSNNKIQSQSG
ncbi:MAG: YfhO family protein, partial [Bacteroidia bacterium]|nr:YfhO family protein [Bacteroidia bacterium]